MEIPVTADAESSLVSIATKMEVASKECTKVHVMQKAFDEAEHYITEIAHWYDIGLSLKNGFHFIHKKENLSIMGLRALVTMQDKLKVFVIKPLTANGCEKIVNMHTLFKEHNDVKKEQADAKDTHEVRAKMFEFDIDCYVDYVFELEAAGSGIKRRHSG